MRVTRTIRAESREEICDVVRRLKDGSRVMFLDPEATDPQQILLRILLDEFARKALWNGRRLSAVDWRRMFLAAARNAEVGPGVEEGTAFVAFAKDDTPSVTEASNMIELLHKYAAENGFTLSEDGR